MKRLLPTTFLLLTAIIACWWLSRSPRIAPTTLPVTTAPSAARQQGPVPAQPVSAVRAASAPAPATFVRDGIRQLRSVEGWSAQVDVRIVLLGQDLNGTGTCAQFGQGFPRVRWDLEFDCGGEPLRMTQIFDGRFHYLLRSRGGDRALTFIDQYQVPSLPDPEASGLTGPAGWFGVGGVTVLLEQLANSFELRTVGQHDQTLTGGRTMHWSIVEGTWHPHSLRQLLRGQVDPANLAGPVRWDRLPAQMPRAVRIALGSDGYLEQFPYQIIFGFSPPDAEGNFRFDGDRVEWRLHHVTLQADMDPATFVVNSSHVVPVDLTSDYLARLKTYLCHPLD